MAARCLALVVCVMVAACTAVDDSITVNDAEDPAVLRLVEAATRAESALLALAYARDGGERSLSPPRVVPEELLQKVRVDWIGPIEALARDMAERAGYRFSQSGKPPVSPVMVTIRAHAAPLVSVLRDAGLQAGDRARLVVDAGAREIRIERLSDSADDI